MVVGIVVFVLSFVVMFDLSGGGFSVDRHNEFCRGIRSVQIAGQFIPAHPEQGKIVGGQPIEKRHGFGGAVPDTWEEVRPQADVPDLLSLWQKVR